MFGIVDHDMGMKLSLAGAGRVPLLTRLVTISGTSTVPAPKGASLVFVIAQGPGGNGRPHTYLGSTHLVGGGGGGGGCFLGPCSPSDTFVINNGNYAQATTVVRNGVELCAGLWGTDGDAVAAGVGGGWRGTFGLNGGDAGKTPTSDGYTNGLIPGGKWEDMTVWNAERDASWLVHCGGGGAPAYLGTVGTISSSDSDHTFGAGGPGGRNGAPGAVVLTFY